MKELQKAINFATNIIAKKYKCKVLMANIVQRYS
jgi:hypothetical protein